jgi:hypothetical protein
MEISHIRARAVPSKDAVTIRFPSGLNLALLTLPVCPRRDAINLTSPDTFHIRAVLSTPAVTMSLPSGLKSAPLTLPSCPFNCVASA